MGFWDKASKIGASVGKAVIEEGKKKGSFLLEVPKMSDKELKVAYKKGRNTLDNKLVENELKKRGLIN